MQNVQNATEIQQRVINLVELYRIKVGKESNKAKELAAEYKAQYDQEINFAYAMYEQGVGGYVLDIQIPEEEIDYIRVNEQLLGHFYMEVAGKDADSKALSQLLADKYDTSVFSEEEESFLKNNFQPLVNYIIQTPCNDLQATGGYDRKDALLLPTEVIELIKKRVNIPAGAIVYNPFAGYGQFPIAYPECSFYCTEGFRSISQEEKDENRGTWTYAWLKVATFANQLKVAINHSFEKSYDAVMSYLYAVQSDEYEIGDRTTEKILEAYNNLKCGGKMILVCPKSLCWGISNYPEYEYGVKPNGETVKLGKSWRGIQHAFRHAITSDGAIVEIIQLPQVMNSNAMRNEYSILIIEKGRCVGETTMIDARFSSKESNRKNSRKTLDLKAFDAMLSNQGYDVETGLRKMVKVPATDINEDFLIPQTYVVEKPSENEKPVPLSSLCQLVTERVKDVKYDLPLDTPLVSATNLTITFNGVLDLKNVDKANCPNIPPHTDEYTFDENGNFVDDPGHYLFCKGTEKDMQVAEYRQCKFLDGSKDAVLLSLTRDVPKMALYQSTGNPIAVETHPVLGNKYFHVICPKDGVDAMHLYAVLRNPIVYRQLQAYEEFGLYGEKGYLKDVLVPTDKRIINDEIQRLHWEQDVYKTQEEELTTKKKEYINEVRMRKHDMGQYIFELMNIEDLMRYYLDNKKDDKNFFQQIRTLLDNFRDSLRELSTMLDNLSKEEQFGEPEPIDIHDFLLKLENRHQADGYKILTILDLRALRDYREKIAKTMGISVSLEDIDSTVPMIYISRNDLQRMVNNIFDNAHKHGFTDSNRKDYEIQVWVSIDANKRMFQFDFRNNGNPLPEGMNKMRYGIKGEKAGKTGGTGMGGNYVKAFVEHYGGDYDIFMEDGWTVVRILLPIK